MSAMTAMIETNIANQTGISRVIAYTASPVESCDRCAAGIKNVFVIVYRDGFRAKFGSECIKKMLDAAPDMLALFNKNAKRLAKYQEYVRIMTGPVEDMPRGREYFNSGLYFLADSKGKDIAFNCWYFHPRWDVEKNLNGRSYVVKDAAATERKHMEEIRVGVEGLRKEIERLEVFLGRVIAKGIKQQGVAA